MIDMRPFLTREQALEELLNRIPSEALVVTCNGKLGRELFELRKKRGESNDDFIMIGSMGCALPIALGVALNTKKEVYCLLGDGNFLMKMGAYATYLRYRRPNLKLIILNNGRHDSTGGQPTNFFMIDEYLPFLEVIDILPGARSDLGRPTLTAVEIKDNFMKKVNEIPIGTLPR